MIASQPLGNTPFPRLRCAKGVSILEFTFVVFAFFLLVFAIIEFSRYFATQALLTKAAQNALAKAKTVQGFELDIAQPGTTADMISRFNRARSEIEGEGLRLLDASFVRHSDAAPGTIRLLQSRDEYSSTAGTLEASRTFVVLRPGDSAKTDFNHDGAIDSNEWIDHPELSMADKPSNATMGQLFRRFPMLVQVRAELPFLFPGIGKVTIVGSAAGYREILVKNREPMDVPDPGAAPSGPPGPGSSSSGPVASSSSSSSSSACHPPDPATCEAQSEASENCYTVGPCSCVLCGGSS